MTASAPPARAAGAPISPALFRLVFLAGALFLAAALIAVLLIEERPLRGPASDAAVDTPPAE